MQNKWVFVPADLRLNGRIPFRKRKVLMFFIKNWRLGVTFLGEASALLLAHSISSILAMLSVDWLETFYFMVWRRRRGGGEGGETTYTNRTYVTLTVFRSCKDEDTRINPAFCFVWTRNIFPYPLSPSFMWHVPYICERITHSSSDFSVSCDLSHLHFSLHSLTPYDVD